MKLIERDTDVITGSSNLEDLYTIPDFPVFMGSVESEPEDDLRADMVFSISKDSGLIQLKKLLPLDILYQEQTTTSAIGGLWKTHHKEFAKFIHNYSPSGILELGGAHGVLSVEYKKYMSIPWTILEPNPAPVAECNATYIKGYFDKHFLFSGNFDAVVHSHVFEHLYEPVEFVKNISEFVNEGQLMIFSVPDLKSWLRRKFTNCLDFEHTIYLTEPYIDYILSINNFEIIDKKSFMKGHSIFYSAKKIEKKSNVKLCKNLYEENKNEFKVFIEYLFEYVEHTNRTIDGLKGSQIFLFGASGFAQYLVSIGLNQDKIKCILDNDKKKQGGRLYGTNLTISSPSVLAGLNSPIVILKAGVYDEEIKSDILKNINPSAVFI